MGVIFCIACNIASGNIAGLIWGTTVLILLSIIIIARMGTSGIIVEMKGQSRDSSAFGAFESPLE